MQKLKHITTKKSSAGDAANNHAPLGGGLDQSKSEMRLRNSNMQFNKLADQALNSVKNGQPPEVSQAMKEAQGFNIVTSKSTKVLPKAG